MSQKNVLSLNQAAALSLVGGKALSLNTLLKNGFRAVDGFVVTTAAFGQMSAKLKEQVLKAFDELDADYVAVRSSAVAEDGQNATWAGQLDTFLNIGKGELIQTIKKCWAAVDSERARSYAKQMNARTGKLAVIIQPMVQSDAAGVAFSIHPVMQNKNQIVIEAGLGLGEAVVSGEVTPDNYIVDKKSYRISQKHIAKQVKKLVQGKSGVNEWQEIVAGDKQKLSDGKIKELAQTVIQLEKFYGLAIDVEWLLKNNELFIMQVRPITTLA